MITYIVPSLSVDIGEHPVIYNKDDFDYFIAGYGTMFNFADELPYEDDKTKVYWHPINEFGYWTYQPFYFFTILMDKAIERKDNIYVHCHAGAHRSPMMVYLYLRSLGNSPDEAYKLFEDNYVVIGDSFNWLEDTFQNDVEYGRIPEDIVEFMQYVRKNKNMSMMHIMKNRGVMDLPEKTKQHIAKKPVGQKQIIDFKNGTFSK